MTGLVVVSDARCRQQSNNDDLEAVVPMKVNQRITVKISCRSFLFDRYVSVVEFYVSQYIR